MSAPLVSIRNLSVRRASASSAFELHVDALDIALGDRLALVGPSGCGKSTLLDVIAMVLIPDRVEKFTFTPPGAEPIDARPLLAAHAFDKLGEIRRLYAGYVLQTGGLLPFVSVRRNIELPLVLLGKSSAERVARLAETLGIAGHLGKMPAQLSAGERQRVAIARALVHDPKLVIADEPTAALDPARSDAVMRLFVAAASALGIALVVATHDLDRVVRFGLRPIRHEFLPSDAGTTASRFVT